MTAYGSAMPDRVEFQIRGLGDVVKRMREFAPKVQKKGVRAAARKAMNIVRDAARQGARRLDDPATAENIAKNIVTRESTRGSRRIGGIVMRVGVMGGASRNQHSKDASGNPGGDTRHWRHIEFGTEFVPARSFMRPALESNVSQVTDRFVEELNKEIDKL